MSDSNEDLQSLINFAYFYLKFRLRTKKEVRDYLLKKIKKRHWSHDHVAQVIKNLEEQGLVNDEEFIRWFVESRNKSKPKSVYVLRRELRRFGIEQEQIDAYFEKNNLDEEFLAQKALSTRWHRFADLDKQKRFDKSAQFLLQRGFSYEIIKKTVEKMENGE